MADVLLYPRILFVSQFRPPKASNLVPGGQKIVLASTVLPGVDIGQTAVADLIHSIEAAGLDHAALHQTYHEVEILKSLDQYEWLLADRPANKLLAAPIQGYAYLDGSGVTAAHGIRYLGPAISIAYTSINSILMHRISRAKNLSELPAAAADLINAHRPGSLRRTRVRAAKVNLLTPPMTRLPPHDGFTATPDHPSDIAGAAKPPAISETPVFETYFGSILELSYFLTTNLTNTKEHYASAADIEISGDWRDGRQLVVRAYKLTGGQTRGGWLAIGTRL